MTPAIGVTAAALLAFCVLAEAAREIGFKIAATTAGANPHFAMSLARQPALWLAIAVGAVEIVAWILVLQTTPLAIAYPIISLAYVAVPLAGMAFLGERMTRRQTVGALLIAFGAMCVGFSGV